MPGENCRLQPVQRGVLQPLPPNPIFYTHQPKYLPGGTKEVCVSYVGLSESREFSWPQTLNHFLVLFGNIKNKNHYRVEGGLSLLQPLLQKNSLVPSAFAGPNGSASQQSTQLLNIAVLNLFSSTLLQFLLTWNCDNHHFINDHQGPHSTFVAQNKFVFLASSLLFEPSEGWLSTTGERHQPNPGPGAGYVQRYVWKP